MIHEKLISIKAIPFSSPLSKTFQGSNYLRRKVNAIIIKVETETGVSGEAYFEPPEGVDLGAISTLINDYFSSLLKGHDPLRFRFVHSIMKEATFPFEKIGINDKFSKGILKNVAISMVDIGLWDLNGKLLESPVSKILGGFRESIPVMEVVYGNSEDDPTHEQLAKEIEDVIRRGIHAIKLKVGYHDVKTDIGRLKVAREIGGEDFAIACDSNKNWTLEQAISFSKEARHYSLTWLEEPIVEGDELNTLAILKRYTNIPIAGGQFELYPNHIKDMMANGALDIPNCDIGFIGGVTGWLEIASIARQFNGKIAHHLQFQLAIHLLSSIENGTFVEILHSERDPLGNGLLIDAPKIKDGEIKVPEAAGFGMKIKDYAVKNFEQHQ